MCTTECKFKLLMELFEQNGVSLRFTRWLAAALQKRKIAMRLGDWISTPQQLTMGLPQAPPPPPPFLPCPRFSTMSTQRDWWVWTAKVYAGWVRLRTTGLSRNTQPVTPTQQSPLSMSSWKYCHSGAEKQSPKPIQARREPCGAR